MKKISRVLLVGVVVLSVVMVGLFGSGASPLWQHGLVHETPSLSAPHAHHHTHGGVEHAHAHTHGGSWVDLSTPDMDHVGLLGLDTKISFRVPRSNPHDYQEIPLRPPIC